MIELRALLPAQWDALARWIHDELGHQEAVLDVFRGPLNVRNESFDLLDSWVEELAGRYTKQDFFVEAQRRGIPCAPVNSTADLLDDPHLRKVGGWAESEHPDVGRLRSPQGPLRFDGIPMSVGPVPRPGEHTDEVLADLGLTSSEVEALRVMGVI
jgi:formyl-CoA transferase